MHHDDPIQQLESHYERLRQVPVPPLKAQKAFRWWEAAGGMVAGAAAVAAAVVLTMASQGPAPSGPSPIFESQMRSAGLLATPAVPPRHAEREQLWHI